MKNSLANGTLMRCSARDRRNATVQRITSVARKVAVPFVDVLSGAYVDDLGGPVHSTSLDLHLSWVAIQDVEQLGEIHGATAECFNEDDVLTAVAVKPRAGELVNLRVIDSVLVEHEAGLVGSGRAVADVDLGWREAGATTLESLVLPKELLASRH